MLSNEGIFCLRKIMTEEFLHYIFKNRLWDKSHELTIKGDSLEIIDTGMYNTDSGPDFSNSKIKINDKIWVGNVEIHINASDWYKHKHDKDLAYGNVILHIVFNADKPVFLKDNSEIPCWEIKFPHIIYNKYAELKNLEKAIPCADYIELVDENIKNLWLEKMAIERLENKVKYLENLSLKTNNNIEEIFYISLARSFGFGTNSNAFENLAFSLPIKILLKYIDDNLKIEALLFGQSGLLPEKSDFDFVKKLITEYKHLAKIHKLSAISSVEWKKSKMRPSNFTQIRIAQFANLISIFKDLVFSITNFQLCENTANLLKLNVSDFWKNHYTFEKETIKTNSKFSKSAKDIISINTLIPFAYFYFNKYSNNIIEDKIISWLESIKAESNKEVREWEKLGFSNKNAYESQALLHLKRDYCNTHNCHNCAIGLEIFKQISLM